MTDIETIRLRSGDKTVPYHFSDAELQSFLDDEGSVDLAIAAAWESRAASYATNPDSEKIGDYSYTQSIVEKMLKMAADLRATVASVPAITWAEPDLMGTEETE